MKILLTLFYLLVAFVAQADLTLEIVPGDQLAPGERPTTDKLNRMARPTGRITGTLGGTNAGLAAGSVNGTLLSDSVAGSNLTWNANSPRGLIVAHDGIYPNELATNVAGLGLAGGHGAALSNRVDGTTLRIVTSAAGIGTNAMTVGLISPTNVAISSGYLLGGGAANFGTNITVGTGLTLTTSATNATLYITNQSFTSAEYPMSGTSGIDTNHGLGVAPMFIRWVIVCKTNDLNYNVGDEVDACNIWNDQNEGAMCSFGANATNVFLTQRTSDGPRIYNKTTAAAAVNINAARWRFKVYARP